MRLVIAEKPSVAQSIAAVLGAKSRHDGYLEGSGYIVSWCFGHLAELADAAVYNADDAKWTLAALPIIPISFRFIVRSEKQKQFDILRELVRREYGRHPQVLRLEAAGPGVTELVLREF